MPVSVRQGRVGVIFRERSAPCHLQQEVCFPPLTEAVVSLPPLVLAAYYFWYYCSAAPLCPYAAHIVGAHSRFPQSRHRRSSSDNLVAHPRRAPVHAKIIPPPRLCSRIGPFVCASARAVLVSCSQVSNLQACCSQREKSGPGEAVNKPIISTQSSVPAGMQSNPIGCG